MLTEAERRQAARQEMEKLKARLNEPNAGMLFKDAFLSLLKIVELLLPPR